jgi:uncharacterized protein
MTDGTPTPVTADGARTTAAADPRELVERVHRLAAAYDLRGQAELYAPDGVLEWPFAPTGVPHRIEGRERIREVLASLEGAVRRAGTRMTAVHTTAVHQTADPEVMIVEFEVAVELTTTGATYQLPYIQVFRIRDGQILLFRDYFGPGTAAALEAAFAAGTAGQLRRA